MSKITLRAKDGAEIGTAEVPGALEYPGQPPFMSWRGRLFQAPGFQYGTPSYDYTELDGVYEIPDGGVTVS